MFRLPRLLASLTVPFLLSSCAAPSAHGHNAPATPSSGEAPQIEWQRSLEDALALATAEHRPLLIALNMDGESASDRIVHENYRDPAFVAAANKCVCVVASVFRHNPRDYDDGGRRIPCPRLGCVTCGEHMAMEPRLFEKLLADGERVAPRHALVLPDGKKAWDLSLNFDLHDIDRALFAATKDVAERRAGDLVGASWEELAARRDHAARAIFEERLLPADAAQMRAVVEAIVKVGDRGSLDALRMLAAHVPPDVHEALATAARSIGLAVELAAFLRDRIGNTNYPFRPTDDTWNTAVRRDTPLLVELDGKGTATRTLLLALHAIRHKGEAVRTALGAQAMQQVDAELRANGGPVHIGELLLAKEEPAPAPPEDTLPEATELDRTLQQLESVPAGDRHADWHARFAKASLDLGRGRLLAQSRDAALFFEDAEIHWEKALQAEPAHAEWWIERARTAYLRGQFAAQASFGRRSFEIAMATGSTVSPLGNALAVEALRWVGDGNARLLAERIHGDAGVEMAGIVAGLWAFAHAAASDFGKPRDWVSLASFCGAVGLREDEREILRLAAARFPADREVRQYHCSVLASADIGSPSAPGPWTSLGRLTSLADDIARDHADSADAQWWAGYAHMLAAENDRRIEAPEDAHGEYQAAGTWFAKAIDLRADYADNCKLWIALSWLGRGLAHVQIGHRGPAADCLVEAVKQNSNLASARDGLGYDVLDLVDKIFEWRNAGPSDVDPLQLLDRLLAIAPNDPFFGLAIADSQLREALRADGRNPERVERDTVDAAGQRIRMLMGLPTDEGDRYLRRSIAAGQRVLPLLLTDEDKRLVAQSDTIWAKRMLERNRLDDVQARLAAAASLLGQQAPPADADAAALRDVAAKLRALLGEARPRQREGR